MSEPKRRFKVAFSGFAYVTASDEEEAKEAFDDGDHVYLEYTTDSVEEVDEFTITI